jgi:hypothetical protein
LEGVGTEISFLKRRILRVEDGLALLPGNNIAKLIKVWEEKLRADPAIQMEDSSLCLVGSDVAFSEWLWEHACISPVIDQTLLSQ